MAAAIAAGFAVAWAHQIDRPFVADDWVYLHAAQQHWWGGHAAWDPSSSLFRPLLWLYFGVLYAIAGLHPVAFHGFTAAFALVEALLGAVLARRLGLLRAGPVAAGVLAFHAGVAEPLAWASAASSPISVALTLGAAVLVLGPRSRIRILAAVGLYVLALLTREVVVVAPLTVTGLAWSRPGTNLRAAVRITVPIWLVAVGYGLLRTLSGAGDPAGPYHQAVSSKVWGNLHDLALRAADLVGTAAPLASVGAAVLGIVLAAGLVLSPRRRVIAAGVVWAGTGLLPVVFLSEHSMDPYYLDMCLPGLALAIAAICEGPLAQVRQRTALAAVTVVLLGLALVGHVVGGRQVRGALGIDQSRTASLLRQVEADRVPGNAITLTDPAATGSAFFAEQDADLAKVIARNPDLRVTFRP